MIFEAFWGVLFRVTVLHGQTMYFRDSDYRNEYTSNMIKFGLLFTALFTFRR
jgi:hypothetical protein